MSVTHGLASYTRAGFMRVGTIVYCLCALANPRHAPPFGRLLSPCLCASDAPSGEVRRWVQGGAVRVPVAVCCCSLLLQTALFKNAQRLYDTLPRTVIVLTVVQPGVHVSYNSKVCTGKRTYLRLRCIEESKSTFSTRTLCASANLPHDKAQEKMCYSKLTDHQQKVHTLTIRKPVWIEQRMELYSCSKHCLRKGQKDRAIVECNP